MNIIAPERAPLHALAEITLAGAPVTFVPAHLSRVMWKIDHHDPRCTVVYVAHDLAPSELAGQLGGITAALHRIDRDRRRHGLRVVEPAPELELTAPVRPALRVLAGGSAS